ncbi:hypothetical protein MRX96_050009, partial [Rhipicephalus microplus]
RLLDTPGCATLLYPSFHHTIRRANETDTSLDWRCPGRRATVIYRRGSALYLNTSRLASYYDSAAAKDVVCTYHEVMRNQRFGVRHDGGYSLGPARGLVFGTALTEEFLAVTCAVGESSFGNQIPLLTGLAGGDVERLFRNLTFDELPHLWSVYKKRGYATLFLEEMPSFGLFVYPDYLGFRELPTDYYPVPVMHAMEVHKGLDYFCAGSRLKTKVFLDYLGEVIQLNAAGGNPLFSYVWLSDVPHSNPHALLVLDGPVCGLLKNMQERRLFDDTVVILLSDHGARFGAARTSEIGRHEDKTPFGFIALPQRLLRRYPTVAVNLEVNQRRLVMAYDLHATLLALSPYPGMHFNPSLTTQRGVSLFGHVTAQRGCGDAFVSAQFSVIQRVIPGTRTGASARDYTLTSTSTRR